MRPEVRDLECFLAAAEELSFRRAAKQVGLSQPALSQRIQRLEEGLGVELFRRTSRGVERTAAGEVLRTHAKSVLGALDEAVTATQATLRPAEHRLTLGHRDYVRFPWFAELLRNLLEADEPVIVDHRELDASAIERGLLRRKLDVGLVVDGVSAPDLVHRPLQRGRWVAVVAADHPRASSGALSLASLRDERLVLFLREINPRLYDALVASLREGMGAEPRVVYQTAQLAAGPELARSGLGAFVVASYLLRDVPPGTAVVPIEGLAPISVGYAWHVDNHAPALRLFRRALDAIVPPRGRDDRRWASSAREAR